MDTELEPRTGLGQYCASSAAAPQARGIGALRFNRDWTTFVLGW